MRAISWQVSLSGITGKRQRIRVTHEALHEGVAWYPLICHVILWLGSRDCCPTVVLVRRSVMTSLIFCRIPLCPLHVLSASLGTGKCSSEFAGSSRWIICFWKLQVWRHSLSILDRKHFRSRDLDCVDVCLALLLWFCYSLTKDDANTSRCHWLYANVRQDDKLFGAN